MENKIQWTNDDFIIFKSKQRSFEKYANIMKTFPLVNVAVNKDFQKLFNGFYRVRRGADWQKVYYELLQSKKIQKRVLKKYCVSFTKKQAG